MRSSILPVASQSPELPRATIIFHAIEFSRWPTWAKSLASLKIETDTGTGDTAHRLFHSKPLNPFSSAIVIGIELFAKQCGCERRRAQWNALYPYAKN